MGLTVDGAKTFVLENKIYIIALVLVLCTIVIYYRHARVSSKMCGGDLESRIDGHIKSIRSKNKSRS